MMTVCVCVCVSVLRTFGTPGRSSDCLERSRIIFIVCKYSPRGRIRRRKRRSSTWLWSEDHAPPPTLRPVNPCFLFFLVPHYDYYFCNLFWCEWCIYFVNVRRCRGPSYIFVPYCTLDIWVYIDVSHDSRGCGWPNEEERTSRLSAAVDPPAAFRVLPLQPPAPSSKSRPLPKFTPCCLCHLHWDQLPVLNRLNLWHFLSSAHSKPSPSFCGSDIINPSQARFSWPLAVRKT